MTMQFNYLVFFQTVAISVVIFFLRRVYWHPLSKFPGPLLPATTSFYQFYVLWKGREGQWYRDLHEKYGPVVRCGPDHLSFNDPEMVPIVYHRKTDKTNFHQEFSCPAAIFNQKSHVNHAATKRRFGHAFSLTRVRILETALDEQIEKWMLVLREQAGRERLVDWEVWARYFSFDAISAVSLGEPIGFLDARADVRGLIENMDKSMYLQKMSLYPPIAWFARNTTLGRRTFVAQRSDKQGLGLFIAEIHERTRKRIASTAHQEKPFNGDSMLDQWLSARNTNGESIPIAVTEDQLLMDMLAGPDSISLMTTNLTFLMAAHPQVLKRAQMEVDEAFRHRRFSVSMPTYDECRGLPFVDACVREGLRIVASTFPRRRSSPPDVPFYLAGKFVPPGTSVSASACEIGRNKKLYGEDAEHFIPDRWLQASEEQLRLWETLDVHWGFGVRKCLGKHIGLMVLYKSMVLVGPPLPCAGRPRADITKLLRQFELELENTTTINTWSYPSSYSIYMIPRNM